MRENIFSFIKVCAQSTRVQNLSWILRWRKKFQPMAVNLLFQGLNAPLGPGIELRVSWQCSLLSKGLNHPWEQVHAIEQVKQTRCCEQKEIMFYYINQCTDEYMSLCIIENLSLLLVVIQDFGKCPCNLLEKLRNH